MGWMGGNVGLRSLEVKFVFGNEVGLARVFVGFVGRPISGIIILTVAGSYQNQKMGLLPFNPPLRV